jgi:hypothetical protein
MPNDPMENRASRPVPDPTELTSRAVDALRKELTDIFSVRLEAQKDLTDERFKAVGEAVATAERLRLEQKVDTKTGLDAALAAQKESAANQAASFAAETAKTERNFTEQLKGQRDTFGTAIAAQITRYDDIDKRVTRIESIRLGGQESKAALYAGIGITVTLLLAALTVLSFVIANH